MRCPRIGVDLVETERIDRLMARYGERFLRRVYSRGEREYCRGRVASLAVRWAAKEAVVKALGCGFGEVCWTEIEVLNDAQGAPHLHLSGQALARAQALGLTEWAVSLSHTAHYATAFVLAS